MEECVYERGNLETAGGSILYQPISEGAKRCVPLKSVLYLVIVCVTNGDLSLSLPKFHLINEISFYLCSHLLVHLW